MSFIVTAVVTVVLAALTFGAALAKLRGNAQVGATLDRLGVGEMQVTLGLLELAGALGLLVGLVVVPIGVLAAISLVGYFIGAVFTHMRAGDPVAESGPAIAFGLLAIAAAWLRTTSA
jgi:hypothetical protein